MTHRAPSPACVIIGPTLPYRGGIAQETTLLYEELKKKYTTHFISFSRQYPAWLFPGKSDKDPSCPDYRNDHVEYILDSVNPISWISTAHRVVKYAPKLLIMPWWVAFWVPQFLTIALYVKLFSSTRIMFVCHNVIEHESSWLKKFLTTIVLRRGRYFLVHSSRDESNLKKILPKAEIKKHYLPFNHIQIERYPIIPRDEAKRTLHIDNRESILFFGFVRRYKGLTHLLQAMPLILQKKPRAVLLIAGEFWHDKPDYIDLIHQLQLDHAVRIVDDYIPNADIARYFSAADVVVAPYESATGSGVLAMAYGYTRSVVASRTGSFAELVDHGKTGYLVEPGNTSELADAVLHALCDRTFEQLENNIEGIRASLSWEHLANTIEPWFNNT